MKVLRPSTTVIDGILSTARRYLTLALASMLVVIMTVFTSAQQFGLPELTNLNGIIWSPTVSPNGHEIFYTNWSDGNWELYSARRESVEDEWEPAFPVSEINSPSSEDGIAVSQDGLTVIFGSERSGGEGNWDIWQSMRPDIDGDWSEPVNLKAINTSGGEITPSLSADGLTLLLNRWTRISRRR